MAQDDMYDDAGGGEATAAESSKPDKEGAATALLPKSFFPEPPEVGKVCKITVTKIFDDQAQVEYVKSEPKEEEVDEEMEAAPEEPMSDMMA